MIYRTHEKEVIENFIKELDGKWMVYKPLLAGLLFPDAKIMVKAEVSRWLHDSAILKEAQPPAPDGYGGWLKHGSPEWLVVCDDTNNPPEQQARNHILVTIQAKMFDNIVRHTLET